MQWICWQCWGAVHTLFCLVLVTVAAIVSCLLAWNLHFVHRNVLCSVKCLSPCDQCSGGVYSCYLYFVWCLCKLLHVLSRCCCMHSEVLKSLLYDPLWQTNPNHSSKTCHNSCHTELCPGISPAVLCCRALMCTKDACCKTCWFEVNLVGHRYCDKQAGFKHCATVACVMEYLFTYLGIHCFCQPMSISVQIQKLL